MNHFLLTEDFDKRSKKEEEEIQHHISNTKSKKEDQNVKIIETKTYPTPKNKLGFWELLIMSITNILGSGIFIVLGKTIFYGGDKVFASILFVGFLTVCIASIYSEIFEWFNHSAICEFLAVKESLGERLGQVVSYLLYIFPMFTSTTMTTTISKNILHLLPFELGSESSLVRKVAEISISLFLLVMMSIINYAGIETSKTVSMWIGMGLISILIGILMLGSRKLNWKDLCCLAPKTSYGSNEFFLSVMMSFFLFNGYDFTIKMRDETQNPADNVRVLYFSIFLSVLIFMLLVMVCLCVFRFRDFQQMYDIIPNIVMLLTKNYYFFWIVYFAGIVIMFNTAFLGLVSSTRYLKAMGDQNEIIFSEFLKKNDNPQKSPENAIIFTFFFCAFLSIVNNETLLAIGSNASAIIILFLLSISLLLLRIHKNHNKPETNIFFQNHT